MEHDSNMKENCVEKNYEKKNQIKDELIIRGR